MRRNGSNFNKRHRKAAFSLIEVMMAVIILGLGLVMVATMFPVAWDRARTLAEFTTEQSVWPLADQTVRSLVPCATTDFDTEVPGPQIGFTAMGFAGDLLIDGAFDADPAAPPPPGLLQVPGFDNRVHALNLQNIRIAGPRQFVDENPWALERLAFALDATNVSALAMGGYAPAPDFVANNYTTARVLMHQRVYPPMERVPNDFYDDPDNPQWEAELDTKRFAWGVLHRLRTDFTQLLNDVAAAAPAQQQVLLRNAATSTRVFDMYYVTLRRSNQTNRYARQDATDPGLLPNPTRAIGDASITPQARPPAEDVLFPVPWRVQIQLPGAADLARRGAPIGDPEAPTNTPTEAAIPPGDFSGPDEAAQMLVNMFPKGTLFVDELNGQVYEVTAQRLVDAQGRSAVLTLDREVFEQDIQEGPANFRIVRNVWVYPPPAPNREAADIYPPFEGNSPVVDIQLRTVPISPRQN